MNARTLLASLIVPVIAVSFLLGTAYAAPPAEKAAPGIKWQKDLRAAHDEAMTLKKPLLIVFDAEWCTYCKKLEQQTLSDKRMARFINAAFIPLHLDLEKDSKIAKALDVNRVPCTVILSPDADLLGRLIGYADVDEYYTHLQKARRVHKLIRQAQYVNPATASRSR
jgi:thioredoxin-related protein